MDEPIYKENAKNEPAGSYRNDFAGNGEMMLLLQDLKDPKVKQMIKRVKGFRVDGNKVIFDFFDGLKWRRRKVKSSRLLGACAP